ncbi:MAG TPA: alanine dehydrogenase [Nitrospirota bacterium]|nr:alanine dehydrogenase [Nitrospirota bacterium]
MKIGVPKEIKDQEFRVSMIPAGVRTLTGHGHTVLIQRGAGTGSGISDDEYIAAGGVIVNSAEELFRLSEMIVKVKEPVHNEYSLLRNGQVLFTFLHLAADRTLTEAIIKSGIIAIAYETVQTDNGSLPLLIPMSEIAGRVAAIAGAYHLQRSQGGSGILISGIPGVLPGKVTILGAGTVGQNAARIAVGLGASVVMLNRNFQNLRYIDDIHDGRIMTLSLNEHNIEEAVLSSDIVIGAVLIPGSKAPFLISKDLVGRMRKGSVIVDVSIDQGGCTETSRPTTHSDPVYNVEGVVHYCVANMPGAFPRTSTIALAGVTLPYIIKLANLGWRRAVKEDPSLVKGVNIAEGRVTHAGVAKAFGLRHEPLS